VLLHVAVYAGIPAANAAFSVAKKELDKSARVSYDEDVIHKSQEDA
jgi:alkylhydroperoxidase/carboxymuconolactone decarboxylase family protein YurZ